jgi:hypothetical protein
MIKPAIGLLLATTLNASAQTETETETNALLLTAATYAARTLCDNIDANFQKLQEVLTNAGLYDRLIVKQDEGLNREVAKDMKLFALVNALEPKFFCTNIWNQFGPNGTKYKGLLKSK